jgi:hypothetical protein
MSVFCEYRPSKMVGRQRRPREMELESPPLLVQRFPRLVSSAARSGSLRLAVDDGADRQACADPVRKWLEGLELEHYAPAFSENDIDFEMLRDLTDGDLKELGVVSLGHRKKLQDAIAGGLGSQPKEPARAAIATEGERRRLRFSSPISPGRDHD